MKFEVILRTILISSSINKIYICTPHTQCTNRKSSVSICPSQNKHRNISILCKPFSTLKTFLIFFTLEDLVWHLIQRSTFGIFAEDETLKRLSYPEMFGLKMPLFQHISPNTAFKIYPYIIFIIPWFQSHLLIEKSVPYAINNFIRLRI